MSAAGLCERDPDIPAKTFGEVLDGVSAMGTFVDIPRCPPDGEGLKTRCQDDRLRAKFEDVECPRFISVGSLLYTVCHTIPNIWYWWSVQLICVVVVCHPLWDVATR
jgi:hypothetical protein